jgi:pimeloyl-ACP methyl ester carboxylesterase
VIVDDIGRVLAAEAPERPVIVGLSIGGLYAARAVLAGVPAAGLVFLNTLRVIGPRLKWVGDAMVHYVSMMGIPGFIGATFPLLVNEEFAEAQRPNFLKGGYQPLPDSHGHMNLMRNSLTADWDLPYEDLTLPVLSITGLQDRVFFEPAVVDRLFARLPQARREDWADAGHLLPLERPAKLAEALAVFGREIEGAAP